MTKKVDNYKNSLWTRINKILTKVEDAKKKKKGISKEFVEKRRQEFIKSIEEKRNKK